MNKILISAATAIVIASAQMAGAHAIDFDLIEAVPTTEPEVEQSEIMETAAVYRYFCRWQYYEVWNGWQYVWRRQEVCHHRRMW